MGHLFQAVDLRFSYSLGQTKLEALRGLNFVIKENCFLALSGPSGSGKSTLLNLLGLIENVQTGSLQVFGQELKTMSSSEANNFRRFKIGFVFQSFHLMNVLSAFENVEYFLFRQGLGSAERRDRVTQALKSVGLWEHRDKLPLSLSGGQRQRVAIARAIAKRPQIIIADEPTASLDQTTGTGVMQILRELNQNLGTSIIASSHDPMVLKFCPEVWRLVDGQLSTSV